MSVALATSLDGRDTAFEVIAGNRNAQSFKHLDSDGQGKQAPFERATCSDVDTDEAGATALDCDAFVKLDFLWQSLPPKKQGLSQECNCGDCKPEKRSFRISPICSARPSPSPRAARTWARTGLASGLFSSKLAVVQRIARSPYATPCGRLAQKSSGIVRTRIPPFA